MVKKKYDRRNQDIGNIVSIEHVNVRVPDQSIATAFYVMGLGFTRDPYLMVGSTTCGSTWASSSSTCPPARRRCSAASSASSCPISTPSTTRLGRCSAALAGTQFVVLVEDKHVRVTCPWGNRLRFYAPGPEFGDLTLGMLYVEFPVPPGHARRDRGSTRR